MKYRYKRRDWIIYTSDYVTLYLVENRIYRDLIVMLVWYHEYIIYILLKIKIIIKS